MQHFRHPMWGSASTSKNVLNTLNTWRCSLHGKLEKNVDFYENHEITRFENEVKSAGEWKPITEFPFPNIELKKDVLTTKRGNGLLLHKENKLVGDDGWNVWWRCLAACPKK